MSGGSVQAHDAVSVSLTFYFESEPNPVPGFLIGRRGRNPRVHAYGFHMFSEEPDFRRRSHLVDQFVADCVEAIGAEVDESWLLEHECELRVYITIDQGSQNGALRLDNASLGKLAELGAVVDLEVL